MLKLYHAEPVANSLKTLINLEEKGLAFESVYIDLHKFERPGVKAAFAMPDHTNPAFRTFTGEAH